MNFFFFFTVKCWKWKVQEKVHPRCTFSGPMPGQIAFDFLSSAKRVNNRESNIARGWSYSQQSNLYLKKAALYSLENPRILWSCQPLISKGSLPDRDLDLSYGTRELWFLHQICWYYTVCRNVEAYTLGRLSIDGFCFERAAQSNLEWIFSNLDSGFQSLEGFRIPSAGFRIPKPRIPDSTSKKFLDSGIRIPLHGAIHRLFTLLLVSVYSHCWPFFASRDFCDNVLLVLVWLQHYPWIAIISTTLTKKTFPSRRWTNERLEQPKKHCNYDKRVPTYNKCRLCANP